MILAETASSIPSWTFQLGIAVPFVLALAFVGRWLIARLDRVETEKNALYEKLINDVVPALKSSTDLAEEMLTTQRALAADRATMVAKMDDLERQRIDLLARSEELRRAEISAARSPRRGSG